MDECRQAHCPQRRQESESPALLSQGSPLKQLLISSQVGMWQQTNMDAVLW